jgi:hypothetical protein
MWQQVGSRNLFLEQAKGGGLIHCDRVGNQIGRQHKVGMQWNIYPQETVQTNGLAVNNNLPWQ